MTASDTSSPSGNHVGSWYLKGLRAAVGLPALILAATFVGIGSVCEAYGMPLLWAVLATILVWAGPAHLILVGGLGTGASWIVVAIAVGLSSVRLLPMVVSIVPYLRAGRPSFFTLLLASHFVAISSWVEGLRLLPGVAPEGRLSFYGGMATGYLTVATLFTVAGYAISGVISPIFGAGLLFLTPMFFLLSLLGASRTLGDHLPVVAGIAGVVITAPLGDGLELLWAGVGGGTLAYLGARALRRRGGV